MSGLQASDLVPCTRSRTPGPSECFRCPPLRLEADSKHLQFPTHRHLQISKSHHLPTAIDDDNQLIHCAGHLASAVIHVYQQWCAIHASVKLGKSLPTTSLAVSPATFKSATFNTPIHPSYNHTIVVPAPFQPSPSISTPTPALAVRSNVNASHPPTISMPAVPRPRPAVQR